MLLISLQVVVAILVLVCAICLHNYLLPKRADTLDCIIARLEPNDWGYDLISYGSFFSEGLDVRIDQVWESISGVKGLWRMFWNVGVLVELADYVAATNRISTELSGKVLELRAKALQIRIAVFLAFVAHIVAVGSRKSDLHMAHRAAWGYSEVVARTTFFLQDYSPQHLSRYLHAMAAV